MDLRESLVKKDGFDLMLRRQGWSDFEYRPPYLDPQVIRLRWTNPPNTIKKYSPQAFYHRFGDNTFRKLLRAIFFSPRTFEKLKGLCEEQKLNEHLAFMSEQEIVEQEGGNWRKSPRYAHVQDISKTLEWYIAEWFRYELKAPARHGVHIEGIGDGGDLDDVAFVDGARIMIECKSGDPANITEAHLELFLRRAAAFNPDVALLLIDTDQEIQKQLEMLKKVYLKSDHIGPKSPRQWNTGCVHVRNIKKSIDRSLRETLRTRSANNYDNRPLIGLPTNPTEVKKKTAQDHIADSSTPKISTKTNFTLPEPKHTREQWLKEAVVQSKTHQWMKALAAYEQVTRIDPDDAISFHKMADILAKLERYNEALATYERVIQLNHNSAAVYMKIGDILMKFQRHEEALNAYEQAIKKAIDDPPDSYPRADAFNRKGNALYAIGRYEEAFAAYDEAIVIDPNPMAFYDKGVQLLKLKRYEEALTAYNMVGNGPPGFDVEIAEILYTLGRYEEALNAYKRAAYDASEIDLIAIYCSKGKTLYNLKRYEEALAAYEVAFTVYERNYERIIDIGREIDLADIYNTKGSILQSMGRVEEACQAYERAAYLNSIKGK